MTTSRPQTCAAWLTGNQAVFNDHDVGNDEAPGAASFSRVVRAPQASTSIADQILARINEGHLPVGTRLPSEGLMAKDFGVSRPTVREALAALQFAGHVESRRGFGTVVISSDPVDAVKPRHALESWGDAIDLLEARLTIEPFALSVAAADPEPRALRGARELIGGMRLAVNDPELHASTDLRVHRALLQTCRNAFVRDAALELLDVSIDPLLAEARASAWTSDDVPRMWAEQHDAVCEAIVGGDGPAARAASLAHLRSVVDHVASAIEDQPGLRRRAETLLHSVDVQTR